MSSACVGMIVALLLSAGVVGSAKPVKELYERSKPDGSKAPGSVARPTRPREGFPAANRTIAKINGERISRQEFLDVLYASSGVRVLRQMLALAAARQLAAKEGIRVTDRDFQAELDRVIGELGGSNGFSEKPLTRDDRRRVLRVVLNRRGVSFEEFQVGLKCQTYLRAVARAQIRITDEMVRDEYRRTYGPRRRISGIVVGDLKLANKVYAKLQGGEDFAQLARRYSTDLVSAPIGGLMGTFSQSDPRLPPVVSKLAFNLPEGGHSSSIKVGQEYWLIRIDKVMAAQPIEFDKVKGALHQKVAKWLERQLMEKLQEQVLLQSKVEVYDRFLDRQYRSWLANLERSQDK